MNRMIVIVHWPLLWAVQLDTGAQLEVQSQVRKLEELRLEKGVQVSTTLLALRLAAKAGEQKSAGDLSAPLFFARQGRHEMLWIKTQELVTKAD